MSKINKEDISFDQYRDLPIKDLLDLIKRNYESEDITSFEYLNWQYNNNPFGQPIATIAKHNPSNQIAGQYIVIPYKVYNSKDGNTTNTSLSLNTLTDKDFRGMGLFTKLAFKTYEYCISINIPITVGFPNNNSLPGFTRKLNFENIGNVPLLIKPISPIRLAFDFLKSLSTKKEKHGEELALNIDSVSKGNIRIENLDWKTDEVEIETFWETAKNNYKIVTQKNFEYLKWRYNCPGRSYNVLKIYDANQIIGLVVLRSKIIFGLKTGVIIDQLFSTDNKNKIKNSYTIINKIFKKNKLSVSMTICSSASFEYSALKKSLFFHVPDKYLNQPFRFIFRNNSLSNSLEYYSDFDNWFLTFGDYDVL